MATVWHWLLQLLIFQKLGKSGFCSCHLQESITQWCMTMVMQTWYQLKAEELLLASTYDLGYEYVYLRNSWPLNFDYLFLGTPCIYIYIYKGINIIWSKSLMESCQKRLEIMHDKHPLYLCLQFKMLINNCISL